MFFKFVAGRPHEFSDEQHIGALTEDDICLAIPPLRRRARSLTKDDHAAEDLLQNTLARALVSRHLFHRTEHEPITWLYEIMRNQFYDGCRAATRSPVRFTDDDAVLHAVEVSGAQYERTLLNEVAALASSQVVIADELTQTTEAPKGGRRKVYADSNAAKRAWRERNREQLRESARKYRNKQKVEKPKVAVSEEEQAARRERKNLYNRLYGREYRKRLRNGTT